MTALSDWVRSSGDDDIEDAFRQPQDAKVLVRELAASGPIVEVTGLFGKVFHCPLCQAHSKRPVSEFTHDEKCVWIRALQYAANSDGDHAT